MPLLQLKHLWRTLMLTVAMVFALSPLHAQTAGINGVNVPTGAICSGQDFTVTFNYFWANFPGTTGPQEIEITVPIPTGLIPASNTAAGGINPFYGTVTYLPNAIRYNITADLSVPSGGGTVQVNLQFPVGVTCDGTKRCFEASTRYKLNNVWSNSTGIPANTYCVTAKAQDNWNVKKDVMWCRWDTAGRSVLYRVVVQNNTSANNWDPTCSINLPTYTLKDVIPAGAYLQGFVTNPPGFTPSSWSSSSPAPGPSATGTVTFTGGPPLNVVNRYYYVYFWVRYPNSAFGSGGTSVLNRVNLDGSDTCKNLVRQFDTVRTVLCDYVNAGALTKIFTQTMGTPPNPAYFPSLAPGCCASYTLVYRNTGTVDQPALVIIDTIPKNVDFSYVQTQITEVGMNCKVEYFDPTLTPFPGQWITIGNYTSPSTYSSGSIPATAVLVRWTYSGTALPVGYTLTNNVAFCVRSNYRSASLYDANNNGSVEPGETIHNFATTSQNGGLLDTAEDNRPVSAYSPKIVAHKMFIGNCVNGVSSAGGPWYPGQTVRYRIAIANIGNVAAGTNCTITDLLPQYLSYVGNETYSWYTATSIPGVSNSIPLCNATTVTPNPPTPGIGGAISHQTPVLVGNQEQNKWTFPTLPNDCDGYPTYLIIDFDVKIAGPTNPVALAGQYCNSYTFVADNYLVEPGSVPPTVKTSNTVCFTLTPDPQFVGDKLVSLSPTGPWSTSASIGAGQIGYYKLKIRNTGNTPLLQLSLLDILPHLNDVTVLPPYMSRNSKYSITLTATPIASVTGSSISTSDFTAMYTTTAPEIKRSTTSPIWAGIIDPVGATTPVWTSTPLAANAFKIELNPVGHPILAPNEYLEVLAEFKVADSAANDSIACNSFAYFAKPGGLPNYNGGRIYTEKGPVCVTAVNPPPSGTDCECDSAFFSVNGDHPNVQEEWKTINVINRKPSAITHIDIQYWDCTTNTQITNSGGLLFQVNGGNAHEIRTTPVANYVLPVGQFNNVIQYQRIPNPPNDFGPFPTPGDPTYQNRITWDMGLNWNANPQTWCIRLIVAHANGDTCKFSLPSWDPDSATNNAGVTQTNPAPGNVHSVTIGVDWTQFHDSDPGYVLVSPLDTTDEVVGGTGGVWESSPIHDVKSPVSNFVQSKRGALFSLYNGKGLDSKITVFISTPEKDKKPRIKWSLYDKNASILSTDTIQTNGTVSIVNPPTIVPGTNDVAINSIIPNPASGSVMFNYTLGASEAVRIELFDPLGKSVGVIADGFQTQGLHQLNYHVGTLAEGTYFLRLTTRFGKASAVVKVIH